MKTPQYVTIKNAGLVMDRPPEEVPATVWTSGDGVMFIDGSTSRVPGYARFSDPLIGGLGQLQFAMEVSYLGVVYWLYCDATHIYVTVNGTSYNITPAGGLSAAAAGEWSGCVLNGVPVLSNPHITPVYWSFNTAASCVALPGWPSGARCKCMRAFKYNLFALGITDGGITQDSTGWWSKSAEPGSIPTEWTPSADNDAGDFTCGDTPGAILDACILRDSLVIYKNGSCYVGNYIAGDLVYSFRLLFESVGIMAMHCVVEYNGQHWVLTEDDVVQHDGQSFTSVVQDKVKRTLIASIEPSALNLCRVIFKHSDSQVWVCIPTTGHTLLNRAYLINALTGDIGVMSLPDCSFIARGLVHGDPSETWSGDSGTWDSDVSTWDQQPFVPSEDSLLLLAPGVPAMFNWAVADTADGNPVTAYVERQAFQVDDSSMRYMAVRIVARIDGLVGETLTVSLGGHDAFGQSIAWQELDTWVIGQTQWLDCQVDSRFFAVRFQGTTTRKWRLHSFRVKLVQKGEF